MNGLCLEAKLCAHHSLISGENSFCRVFLCISSAQATPGWSEGNLRMAGPRARDGLFVYGARLGSHEDPKNLFVGFACRRRAVNRFSLHYGVSPAVKRLTQVVKPQPSPHLWVPLGINCLMKLHKRLVPKVAKWQSEMNQGLDLQGTISSFEIDGFPQHGLL